ncbi:MAG: hypothetical protein AAFN63_04350 [Pseudomonadota bacterium]
MSLRSPTAILAVTMLAACEPPAINASSDSLANRLSVGMSPEQVSAIIGPSQFESTSTLVPSNTCLSYIYDEAINAKFVHAVYQDGLLVSASDRHRVACDLG